MREKGMFLRAVCIAAALSMSVVETPAVSVVSFAAVSGEETPEADTEVEDNSQETEEAAEAVSGDAEEAADQKETGAVTEDDDTGDKAETGTEILEETESGSEGKEEAEADTGTEKETEAEIETEEEIKEEIKEETQGETEISEESRSQEEEPSEHEEIQETDALTEDETAPDPAEGEMKQETEGTVIQDGIVSAEVELNPDQVEAGTTILNEFGVTFPWPAAGTTVAKAKAQISLDSFTNKDQIKSWSVSFRDGGTVLADKATFVKGKTYSVRFDVVLKSGYAINKNTKFSINDTKFSLNISGSSNNFNFSTNHTVQSGQKTILKDVTVNYAWPDAGDTVADAKKTISISNQDQFKTTQIVFSKGSKTSPLADNAVFEKGVQYYLYFDITLKDNVYINNTTKITENGNPVDIGISAGQEWTHFNLYVYDTVTVPDMRGLNEFVTRFYTDCLGRSNPSADEVEYWAKRLHKKQEDGAGIAQGFFESNEYLGKQTSDDQYIDDLYQVFFGREPESDGQQYWLGKIAAGLSRRYVLSGFVSSIEFQKLCDRYMITRGTIKLEENRDQNEGVTEFIVRLYKVVLGRSAETDGLNYWAGKVINASDKRKAMASVAQEIFGSDEFRNKGYNNETTLRITYRVFLNREAEDDGLKYWLQKMQSGMTLQQVLADFAQSNEFRNLMAKYNIR